MTTTTVSVNHTSQPHFVPAGSLVTVAPSAGATAKVEYTAASAAEITNGVATWAAWPKGVVSAPATDLANNPINLRVMAIGGNVALGIDQTPSAARMAAYRADWGGLQALAAGSAATVTGAASIGGTLVAALPAGVTGTLQFTRTFNGIKTAISGAVANAVNSLTYTVQQADVGAVIGCDASNTVVASTGVSIAAVATVRSNGVMRLVGTQNQQAQASALNGSFISAVIKMQAPSGATGARVIVTNASPVFGMAGAKVAMATTDIAACDTATNAYTPFIAGTANNVISATTSDKGFVKGKWNGAAQSRRIYPSNSILPSFGYNNQEDIVVSDVIPLVPKRATDRANEEYYYLLRIAVAGTNGQDGMTQIQGGTGNLSNVLYNAWANSNGADCPLYCVGGLANTVDAVDGSLSSTMPTGIGNGWAPVVSVEWIYPAGVTPTTFWHVGDSITEGYEWPRWAVNRKSTAAKPLHHVNLGGSTTRTESFIGEMYLHLQSLAKPDYVVMPIISVNNYSPLSNFTNNLSSAQAEYTRLQEIAQFLAGLGIKVIWWVPFNFGANPAAGDTTSSWGYLYNSAKAYAAANGITWMDINGDPRMVRSVYNASTNPTGWIDPDNTHPSNPAGKAGFAAVYTDTLTALGF